MKIGYVKKRKDGKHLSIKLQIDELAKKGCEKIHVALDFFDDSIEEAEINRIDLQVLLANMSYADMLVLA
jgi:hypothetical protein